MVKIKFSIKGMHCASCSASIERSLRKINGVKEAIVNLMAKKGFIESEQDIPDEEIRKAVSKVGDYSVKNIEKEEINKIDNNCKKIFRIEGMEIDRKIAKKIVSQILNGKNRTNRKM